MPVFGIVFVTTAMFSSTCIAVFIAMPSRKTGEGEYKDVAHPIKTEMREELIKIILNAFEEEKAKPQE